MVFRCLATLALLLAIPHLAAAQSAAVVTNCGTPNSTYTSGQLLPTTQDTTGKTCVNASVSATATISGFTATSVGTAIVATTSGVTQSLPSGAVVVATNVGASNGAYCALGASSTTAQQYIAPNGGWFAFTVGSSTQLTCITAAGTTTVNTVGGAGLPTGVGGTSEGSRTIVALDVSSVTTASTAVTALAAGHATAGGWLVTANAAGICVDQHTTAGTVTGTPSSTACVAANTPYYLVPNTGAVSVNSTASSVAFAGEGLQ